MKNYEPCECREWAGTGPDSFGEHHHRRCNKYGTEKFPVFFYYEESESSWVPLPDETDAVVNADLLGDSEIMEIKFKRIDMTDAEYDAIPEC